MNKLLISLFGVLLLSGFVIAVEEIKVDLLQERLNTALESEDIKQIVMVCNDINMQRIYNEAQAVQWKQSYMTKSCGGSPAQVITETQIVEVEVYEPTQELFDKFYRKSCSDYSDKDFKRCNAVDCDKDGTVNYIDLGIWAGNDKTC
jgi:hypothetical protein